MTTAIASDGAEIFYRASGDGPPLIFCNPTFSSHRLWEAQEEALRTRHRIITWDYRGHGRSEAPAEDSRYSMDQVVADLGTVHQAASAGEPAAVAGLSVGGIVGMSYALTCPERVFALVLVSTGSGFKRPDARARWQAMLERAAAKLEAVGIEAYLDGPRARDELLGLEPDSPRARRVRQGIESSTVDGLVRFARNVAGPVPNLVDRLADIAQPALVLIGEKDEAFQRSSHVLEAKMPRATRVELPGAGHVANLDQPQAFLAEVEAFLGRVL